jgi:hypothetical protein
MGIMEVWTLNYIIKKELFRMVTEKMFHRIPSENYQKLLEKVAKMNRKAQKMNCPQIQIVEHGTEDEKTKEYGWVRFNIIEVVGESPIIAGWKLIASCEAKENGNLIKSIPNESYPTDYREKLLCEHCNSERHRLYTYIVQNAETNEFKMVGKQCLKDFLGHNDITQYANYLEFLADEELSEYMSIGSGAPRFETEEYLLHVSAHIRKEGWKSRTYASENATTATADIASRAMLDFDKSTVDKENEEFYYYVRFSKISYPLPNEKDLKIVQNAIEWAKNLTTEETEKNDYLYNINLLSKEKTITYKDMGFIASIVSSYIRAIEKQIEQEKKATTDKEKTISDYVGKAGEKGQWNLTLQNIFGYDTQFGYTFIYKFFDAEGNTMVWKTTKGLDIEAGATVTVKGTIKEHSEYNNEKQTVLTRCKVQ